jgi:hypothetical protein
MERKKKEEAITISAPKLQTICFRVIGDAPLVMNKFSQKAREEMHQKQEAGTTAKANKKREPKNFQASYNESRHISEDGWDGIPATAFRSAMIHACKIAGLAMTRAKLAIFVEPDGFDKDDNSPLIKITKGKPEYFETYVRLATGVPDLKARPMWKPGWEAAIRVTYDMEILTQSDIANLLMRAGRQVGICAGRPNSSNSTGMGWGTFRIAGEKDGNS